MHHFTCEWKNSNREIYRNPKRHSKQLLTFMVHVARWSVEASRRKLSSISFTPLRWWGICFNFNSRFVLPHFNFHILSCCRQRQWAVKKRPSCRNECRRTEEYPEEQKPRFSSLMKWRKRSPLPWRGFKTRAILLFLLDSHPPLKSTNSDKLINGY